MAKLSEKGLFADVDNGADTLPKKIRNGEIAQYNFILGASVLLVSLAPLTPRSFFQIFNAHLSLHHRE